MCGAHYDNVPKPSRMRSHALHRGFSKVGSIHSLSDCGPSAITITVHVATRCLSQLSVAAVDSPDSADPSHANELFIPLPDFDPVMRNATFLSFCARQGSSVAGHPMEAFLAFTCARILDVWKKKNPKVLKPFTRHISSESASRNGSPWSSMFMGVLKICLGISVWETHVFQFLFVITAFLIWIIRTDFSVTSSVTARALPSSSAAPSAAFRLSCIRKLPGETGCQARNSSLLLRHPQLLRARKSVLSDLPALVKHPARAAGFDTALIEILWVLKKKRWMRG
ncbi:hypothetical protein SISSUDRAFT_1123719 [Sistotremastrum suecicum HHB10207 ss-3]|uniref:Uncharacterized protein n=1 Tax=Sistotremastrum suecicum HHB10207 ss-3 TaxID=1314776 RepID=A0A165X239_9AGAM|nr:hypothetical protein SISSUDRAFT_1123719 [Sistotremastrum suecicum HHB10207 ss-3]